MRANPQFSADLYVFTKKNPFYSVSYWKIKGRSICELKILSLNNLLFPSFYLSLTISIPKHNPVYKSQGFARKSMDWFLYERELRHERVNKCRKIFCRAISL